MYLLQHFLFSFFTPSCSVSQQRLKLLPESFYLSNGDSQDEPGWGAVGVAVKVPLAVDLSGQSVVGHVPDEPLGQPQTCLISETVTFELPATLKDGPPEAVGALVTHLEEEGRWWWWVEYMC